MSVEVPEIENLFKLDGYLKLHEGEIRRRYEIFQKLLAAIEKNEGLENFCRSYKKYGMHVQADNSISFVEWAPGAQEMFLRGDFNGWQQTTHPFKKLEFGKWELVIPPRSDGSPAIDHLSKIKLVIRTENGELVDRLSPWASYVVQPPKNTGNVTFDQVVWNPPQKYQFTSSRLNPPANLKIYEAHVGKFKNIIYNI